MPSTASSFVIGMATALAIAGGFAGTFIESVSKQRATDLALRETPKAAALNAMRSLPTRSEPFGPAQSVVDTPAPSTSGIAPTPMPINRPDISLPTRAAAIDRAADTNAASATHQAPPAATVEKKARKPRPVQKKPKLEWYEDENIVANRTRGGMFGMFR